VIVGDMGKREGHQHKAAPPLFPSLRARLDVTCQQTDRKRPLPVGSDATLGSVAVMWRVWQSLWRAESSCSVAASE
jgi:hypothetical protein